MSTTQVILRPTKPHEAQAVIMDSPALYKVADCGRRFGKTEMFSTMLGLGHGSGLFQGAVQGYPVAYWSLTYKNVQELWERIKVVYAPLIASKNETLKVLDLITGGRIECWSTEKASSARGRAYKGIIVDEAGWTAQLLQVWQDALQPMLVDFEGWAVFGGTPNGMNDYYTMYQWGQDSEHTLWASWMYPSLANPHLPAAYLEQIRLSVPERTWQQEYEAQFLTDGGAVFRNIMACVDPTIQIDSEHNIYPAKQGDIVIGMDLGRHNDYTRLYAMDTKTKAIVDYDGFTEVSWELQRTRLLAMANRWKPVVIWIEENFNDSFVERLMNDNLPVRPYRTTAQSKQQLINALALAFEQRDLSIPNEPGLIHELQAYTIERLPSGTLRYGAPVGLHDDRVIALALTWHGMLNQPSYQIYLMA